MIKLKRSSQVACVRNSKLLRLIQSSITPCELSSRFLSAMATLWRGMVLSLGHSAVCLPVCYHCKVNSNAAWSPCCVVETFLLPE